MMKATNNKKQVSHPIGGMCPKCCRFQTHVSDGSVIDIDMMKHELARKDLQVFTVCRMAQIDLKEGRVNEAIARLRVDVDKIRCIQTPLNDLLNY